jgi:ppGpp synthetase/RelA/SpoT-type nucleotidyltranferase
MTNGSGTTESKFDFEAHRRNAVDRYQKLRPIYASFAETIHSIAKQSLRSAGLKVASIEWRAKDVESFSDKAGEPSPNDPEQPRYKDPLKEITDLAGVRIITFFPKDVEGVDKVIRDQLTILEAANKGDALMQEERFGYKSVHYLVSLNPGRISLPEYVAFKGLVVEIQVRTILQHAWAEIEHDIQYKSVETIPDTLRRRFLSLAGLIEIADREFQAIQDEDEKLRQAARTSIREGRLETVEITPDALKAYLDRKLGPDGRMARFSYDWTARMLRRMGFSNFQQIDQCIRGYDDDAISRKLWGFRQGQISRFELQLLAAMGENFITGHPWTKEGWGKILSERLEQMKKQGIEIGNHCPTSDDATES